MAFHQKYGDGWQAHYEQDVGSLSKAHERLGAAGLGIFALPALSIWAYRVLTAKQYRTRGQRRRDRHERHISNTERTMRARSKAVLWNYLGLLGIVIGALLVLFRWGIFAEHANESVVGIFVFCAGYCSILCGCWWWLQAKNWSEALIIIGLWPAPIMCIPFVRIVFVHLLAAASPILLLLLMALTPATLVVVIAVLPDKSGVSRKQRKPMNWREIEKRGP
jgi:hypothetical protein